MTDYDLLCRQLEALTETTDFVISDLSNASALLYDTLPDLNWAGFYLMHEGVLKLGPFQGKTACTMIPPGKGVCGAAASADATVRVPNVHAFPGHIACDSASNAEIVVPVHKKDGRLFGVLDLDSPLLNRFSEADQAGLEAFVRILEKKGL